MSDIVSDPVQPLSWREWVVVAGMRLTLMFWVALPFVMLDAWTAHAGGWWNTTLLIAMGMALGKTDSFVKRMFE